MTIGTAPNKQVDGFAAALLDVARTTDDPASSVDEIYRAARGLASDASLVEALSDVRIPGERKQAIVDDLLGSRASGITVAAMGFLVAAGQATRLDDIAARLAEMAADAEGEVVAEVRSASELTDEQVTRLTSALERKTGKKIQVKVVVDPTVMGGLVAKVGDTVLDGSVQHRFEELREQWG